MIKTNKEFLNNDAYLALADRPARETLQVFEIDAQTADASGGEPIFALDGTPLGQVTSGAYGYSVDKSLALGYVKAGALKPGETVHIYVLGRPHTARMLETPPFDPEGERLRGVTEHMEPAQ